MKNADALPKRKPLRLNGYDYSSCGAYFITLCVKDKRRIYIHYYYSIEKGADDEQSFDKRIAGLYRELFDDKLVESHKKPMNSFLKLRLRLSVDARLLTKKMT